MMDAETPTADDAQTPADQPSPPAVIHDTLDYAPPVSRLFSLKPEEPNSYRELGLRHEHASEMLRMLRDPRLIEASNWDDELHVLSHAALALSEMGQIEVLPALLDILKLVSGDTEEAADDDEPMPHLWASHHLPEIAARFGPKAIPYLLPSLEPDSGYSPIVQVFIINAMEAIASRWDKAGLMVGEIMKRFLARYEEYDVLTASDFAISLIRLGLWEENELVIRQGLEEGHLAGLRFFLPAFRRDGLIPDDWLVEYDLHIFGGDDSDDDEEDDQDDDLGTSPYLSPLAETDLRGSGTTPRKAAEKKKKAKRKQAAKSRRQNRKKK
jgi:hypothetical protein